MADDDYGPFQQPVGGYVNGGQSGSNNYAAQQAPASLYAQQGAGGGGGGGGGSAGATKTYHLPDPETGWSSNLARVPAVSSVPLYIKGKKPKYDQVEQQLNADCFLGATLAALANTPEGVRQIQGMIKQTSGAITTICKAWGDQNVTGPEQRISSNRWFTVAFSGTTVDVSDVLYHDDSDKNPNLRYMTTPGSDKALWGAIIEVAYASLKGSYDNMGLNSNTGGTVDTFLKEFSPLTWTFLEPTKKTAIKRACTKAKKKAAFLASLQTGTTVLEGWHGYAILGIKSTTVTLWDPLAGATKTIAFADMLTEIQGVFVRD